MKIDIVYTTKSKYIKCVADEMARWVKTYAQDLNHYHSDNDVDLLVIGFDDTLFKDKQLLEFIQSLSRQNVKNLALINCFFINNKILIDVYKRQHFTSFNIITNMNYEKKILNKT